MLAASVAFASMGALVKLASRSVPTGEIVAWRSLVTAAIVGILAVRAGASLRPVNVRWHLIRGTTGIASMFTYFTAIDRLPLGDAVLLTYLSPILVALASPWVVGEQPPRRIWGALALGVGGVALVVGWRGGQDPLGVAAALMSACFSACAYLSVRVLTRTDSTMAIVWWFSMIGGAIASTSFADGVVLPGRAVAALVVAIGVVGTIAQWFMTRAYAVAEAAQVAVFAYATPVFAYVLGLAALREVPRPESLVGALLVVAAGWIASSDR